MRNFLDTAELKTTWVKRGLHLPFFADAYTSKTKVCWLSAFLLEFNYMHKRETWGGVGGGGVQVGKSEVWSHLSSSLLKTNI